MPSGSVSFTIPPIDFKGTATVTSGQILEVIENTNDLPERAKETVNQFLENYSGEDFKSLSDFLEIGFSPEIVETLQNCTEVIQLFL
jgi:hypothetical protein